MVEENKDEKAIKTTVANKNIWRYATIALLVIVVLLIAVFMWSGNGITGRMIATSLTPEEAANKVISWMTSYFAASGTIVNITLVNASTTENNVYQFTVKLTTSQGSSEETYYVSQDGKLFFPQAIITTEIVPQQQTQQPAQQNLTCNDLTKVDKPELDAFVVSNCPYGLQMQRILSPVVAFFGDKANIKIRYIGSVTSDGKNITSMHGDKEAVENLRQICIREEQSDKFWNYIACYIKKGDTDNCLTEAKIDKTKLNTCMSDTNKGVNYAKEDFALQNQYSVSGSPTLVLNGMVIDSDAERALATNMQINMRSADLWKSITCCGFSTEPSGCSQKLSSEPANTGFSETYSGGSATGSTGATCG